MRIAKAFTLVEVLIVVIILGILAAVVVPQFSNASQAARASMVADHLRIFRTQVAVFAAQHNGVPAGYPNLDRSQAPTEAAFIDHMTMASNAHGDLADPGTSGYNYGPYFSSIPENPITQTSEVLVLGDDEEEPAEPTGLYGWIYQPATLLFKSDAIGTDEAGKSYFDY